MLATTVEATVEPPIKDTPNCYLNDINTIKPALVTTCIQRPPLLYYIRPLGYVPMVLMVLVPLEKVVSEYKWSQEQVSL